jgi:hypothetical protein
MTDRCHELADAIVDEIVRRRTTALTVDELLRIADREEAEVEELVADSAGSGSASGGDFCTEGFSPGKSSVYMSEV